LEGRVTPAFSFCHPLAILTEYRLGTLWGDGMKRLEALIFDVDGTLAATERDGHRVAFNCAFAEAGLAWDWPPQFYGELLAVSGGRERLQHYIGHYKPPLPPGCNADRLIAQIHASKRQHYLRLMGEGKVPLRAGVKRLIAEAKAAGLKLAIATAASPGNVQALLDAGLPGGSGQFSVIGAGDMVPAKKPAPDIYLYVLRELGIDAGACLAIEDSAHGLQAALGAGIKTLVTVNGYTEGQDFTGASLVLSDLGEPEAPFQVISGPAGSATYADLALLRRLCEC
jgi:HAD superfamily hydrolase (TIGR01509 family)